MQVISGIRNLPHSLKKSVVTIGNFDGVHLGHRALLTRLVESARREQAASVVFTFNPHPVQVLYPDRALSKLFAIEDQQQQLEALGVDYLVIEPFSREFSQLDPENYLNDWVFRPLQPSTLIVGYDFTFGVGKSGTIDFLQAICSKRAITVEVFPPVKVAGQLVSSSRIRQALKEGQVRLASELLGRPFYVVGLVERGAARGRQIGVPTANLHLLSETLPAVGVYACWVWRRSECFAAVTNIGFNPTFVGPEEQRLPRLETHLLDFSKDIYGEELRVEFVEFLRLERKFASVDELKAQIHQDIARGRTLLT
jgi:riboflavin kinase/FMN adenylyltransferase